MEDECAAHMKYMKEEDMFRLILTEFDRENRCFAMQSEAFHPQFSIKLHVK